MSFKYKQIQKTIFLKQITWKMKKIEIFFFKFGIFLDFGFFWNLIRKNR